MVLSIVEDESALRLLFVLRGPTQPLVNRGVPLRREKLPLGQRSADCPAQRRVVPVAGSDRT